MQDYPHHTDEWYILEIAGLAPSTKKMYQRDVRVYLDFAGSSEAALNPTTFARWRDHLAKDTKYSPHTINRMLSSVKRIVRESVNQGYIKVDGLVDSFDATASVKTQALRERVKSASSTSMNANDVRRLCNFPNRSTLTGTRDAALLHTLASTGLRVGEVVSLTVRQIVSKDGGCELVIFDKNDEKPRDAPLSREAHRLITTWLERRPVPSEYIFTSFEGRGNRLTAKPLSAVGAWRVVQQYAEAIGLSHIKPHDFRRFVGTQLAQKDVRKAQKALGHKRIDTTVRHYVLDELEVGLTDDLY